MCFLPWRPQPEASDLHPNLIAANSLVEVLEQVAEASRLCITYRIHGMGIFTYMSMYHKDLPNVGVYNITTMYTIHGNYGSWVCISSSLGVTPVNVTTLHRWYTDFVQGPSLIFALRHLRRAVYVEDEDRQDKGKLCHGSTTLHGLNVESKPCKGSIVWQLYITAIFENQSGVIVTLSGPVLVLKSLVGEAMCMRIRTWLCIWCTNIQNQTIEDIPVTWI